MIRLNEDKANRILYAAKHEFRHVGYERASTNQIAKNANVSKGLIFHYFESKPMLYVHVVKKAMDDLYTAFEAQWTPLTSESFFDRLYQFVLLKLHIALQYADETVLLLESFQNPPDEVKTELHALIMDKAELMRKYSSEGFMDELENETIHSDFSTEEVKSFIDFVLNAFQTKYLQQYAGNYAQLLKEEKKMQRELYVALEVLKRGIGGT